MFLNYVVWKSVAHFRAAFTHSEFLKRPERLPIERGVLAALIQQGCSAKFLRRLIVSGAW